MRSLVVMTYYQLMHSIALALTFDERPRLFFSMEFLDPEETLLERIAETNVFSEVKGITRRGDFDEFTRELRKTEGYSPAEIDRTGSGLFDRYLEPLYDEQLASADREDEIYVYNDIQWHYYYIFKHFDRIIGVEDGYASLLQQTGVHRLKGVKELLIPFIERGYYPKPLYREDKIIRILSSRDFARLDDYYKSKLQVWDFRDIVSENEEAFREAVMHIFDIKDIDVKSGSTLYIGQPLDRARYCSALDNYLLFSKIVRKENEAGQLVYYKPHPGDRNDPLVYKSDGTEVLPGDFPIEIFNYHDADFGRLITFGSTSVPVASFAKEKIRLFEKEGFEREDVSDFIADEIRGEKLNIDIYIRVSGMSPETYVNVYSFIFRNRKVRTNLHLLISDTEDAEEYRRYYDKKNIAGMVKRYRSTMKGTARQIQWNKELGWMENWTGRYDPSTEICKVSGYSDETVYDELIRKNRSFDYVMILDEGNTGFTLTNEILNEVRTRIYPAVFFRKHVMTSDEKNRPLRIYTDPGYIGNEYSGDLDGVLWHRNLLSAMADTGYSRRGLAEVTKKHGTYVSKNFEVSVRTDADRLAGCGDPDEYFRTGAAGIRAAGADDAYMAGALAHLVYKYYDWVSVSKGVTGAVTLSEAADRLCLTDDEKTAVFRLLADSVMYEKTRTESTDLVQEYEYYSSIKPLIDRSAQNGALIRMENTERIRNKLHLSRG